MNRANIEKLCNALEHIAEQPLFRWDFSRYLIQEKLEEEQEQCGSAGCTLGLAYTIGLLSHKSDVYNSHALANVLDIPHGTVASICEPHAYNDYRCPLYNGKTYDEITAADVAAKFRALLTD